MYVVTELTVKSKLGLADDDKEVIILSCLFELKHRFWSLTVESFFYFDMNTLFKEKYTAIINVY